MMDKIFDEEVKDGVFPEEKHCFKISDEVIEKLYQWGDLK